MKTDTKNNKTKVDWERTCSIASNIGMLAQFTPRELHQCEIGPLFSREFVLKNLFGLTDEEYELNEELIKKEEEEIKAKKRRK